LVGQLFVFFFVIVPLHYGKFNYKKVVYPQVVEANYLASINVVESLYDREGAKGCVGCKSHKDIKFQKLFIIPCEKNFNQSI
jgi:hypothetical protein